MNLVVDNYQFDFPNAIEAFKFDEKDQNSPYYHGVSKLKAADMIVEFPEEYLFVEIKDYRDYPEALRNHLSGEHWLRNYLSQKYKDSFLYRYAEDKVNKPIVYICLIEMESALISTLRRQLVDEALPVFHHHLPQRWTKELLKAVIVVNEQRWADTLNNRYGTCHALR